MKPLNVILGVLVLAAPALPGEPLLPCPGLMP